MFIKKPESLQLKEENIRLKKEVDELKYAVNAYRERLESEMKSASYVINWDVIKVFSVERIWDNGLPKTIIGYLLEEPVTTTEGGVTTKDVVREWTLYCSAEKHEELAKEFKKWIGK